MSQKTPPLLRFESVRAPLERLRDRFGELADSSVTTTDGVSLTPKTLRAVRDHIQHELDTPEPLPGVYYPSSPIISLLQSAMHDQLARKRSVEKAVSDDEERGDPFSQEDIKGSIGDLGLSLIGRVFQGSPRFCDTPATLDLGPRARLIMFADWGTGRDKARDVARHAREHFDCGAPVHVLHLGDTYYSG